jgi:hypothetical protein
MEAIKTWTKILSVPSLNLNAGRIVGRVVLNFETLQ